MKDSIIYRQSGMDAHYKIWHTIGKNMVIFIKSGYGSIVCNEKSYQLEQGVLCFIGADKYHYTMPEKPSEYERSKVFIDKTELCKLLMLFPEKVSRLFTSKAIVYAKVDDLERADEIFAKIDRYKNSECAFAMLSSCYIELLTLILENTTENEFSNNSFMGSAIEYINRNITESITIDSICKAVHISKYYFCHEFKRVTGLTVMEYILKTRIVLAKSMLEDSRRTVSEVSESCGFSSISYFCRAFKKEVGITPLAYKKQKIKCSLS